MEKDPESCIWCHHDLKTNPHGFDQNDGEVVWDEEMDDFKLEHYGTCTYCRECRNGL